jgi:hypothetical protein
MRFRREQPDDAQHRDDDWEAAGEHRRRERQIKNGALAMGRRFSDTP